jgi:hypothetical protein
MAYVFGIDNVPVFEILFVLIILLLLGLVVILLELRKLGSLIKREKVELQKFEMDLEQFEKDQGKKPSAQLITYVDNAISKGMSESAIEESLAQAGWTKKEIDDIFEKLK